MIREGFDQLFPARWAIGGGGGGGRSKDYWAVVVGKTTLATMIELRGRYTCLEIEWLTDGTWQIKDGGRTFVNCYEASTGSNANLQHTEKNVVHLFRVRTVEPSSSSLSSSSESAGEPESAPSSSSSSSANVDESVYVFDKALGNVLHPARI